MQLAHSWVDSTNMELNTLIQIPIAKLHNTVVLDIENKIHSDLPYAAVTKTKNKYRYLSGSDLQNCDSTDEKLL